MLSTVLLRCKPHPSPSLAGVFATLSSAHAAVVKACERSGIPLHLADGLLEQVRERGQPGNTIMTPLMVACVRVYIPPPLENPESNIMLLFRGSPETKVEERLQQEVGRRRRRIYFSSSLQTALPFGRLDEACNSHRVALCRVERRHGCQLFNKLVASEEELKLFDSVDEDLVHFGHVKSQQSATSVAHGGVLFDGVVDWLDDGVSYCFDADLARVHTLLCIDMQW